jgi:hypothetical protein
MTKSISIGRGVLTWNADERRSDRYGTVYLIEEGHNSLTPWSSPSQIKESSRLEGAYGRLVAVVTAARESTHIGDVFHGVFPRTPGVGARIVLGEGRLFTECAPQGGLEVGVLPPDGRNFHWLDIRALYDAHEQSVELVFEEVGLS